MDISGLFLFRSHVRLFESCKAIPRESFHRDTVSAYFPTEHLRDAIRPRISPRVFISVLPVFLRKTREAQSAGYDFFHRGFARTRRTGGTL